MVCRWDESRSSKICRLTILSQYATGIEGKMFNIESFYFLPTDVVDEMIVSDGLNQRLTLNIENVRAGGGQRRISVFCPYWILNTTEHCLRYRQESSNLFVSGTVISPVKNGSIPLNGDRSRANYQLKRGNLSSAFSEAHSLPNRGTIFSGTPGALASFPGRCDIDQIVVASLIEKNIPLEKMAQLAFMFNFHEGKFMAISNKKVCVQLGDGTGMTSYKSDWSRGFSLETVGIPQVLR